MTVVFAIDPGSERSGFVAWNATTAGLRNFGKIDNQQLLESLRAGVSTDVDVVVIEWTAPRGMLSSAQLFEALWWAGRFGEAVDVAGRRVERLERMDVKVHLCGKRNAKDSNIRQALIDRFGGIGGKAAAVGTKASPGPLHGISADVWQALGVAVTWSDQHEEAA